MILPRDEDSGQLDVAANALAVMILVTMILLTVAAAPLLRGAVRGTDAPQLPFPTELPPDATPRPSYWIVTDAGLARLPLADVARQVAQGERAPVTSVGRFEFINDRRRYRDLDEYRLALVPDMAGIAAVATPITTSPEIERAVADLEGAWMSASEAPTFFVDRSGFARFADLHTRLRARPMPLRWYLRVPGQPLRLTRSPDLFERRALTWR